MEKKGNLKPMKKKKTLPEGCHDCCWYEPPCEVLCCGGACCAAE